MSYLNQLFSPEGKTALITGAGGGIGSALAEALCKAGASAALCDINMDALNEVKDKIGGAAHVFKLDMADFAAFKPICADAAKINGRIDILINCAGINKREGMADVLEETYDRIMDINLKGVFFLSTAAARYYEGAKVGFRY